ncbi:MAG: cytochrome c biogenesis CcdA family protein, partial [Nereida ignava]
MLDFSVLDVTLLPAMGIALVAGIISFLSPCVLPIVPPYLAYMGGVSISDMNSEKSARAKALGTALFFVLGLSTVFLILGFTTSLMGAFFLQNQQWFVVASGVVIMVFGAHFVGVYRIGFMDREIRMDAGDQGGSAFGAYVQHEQAKQEARRQQAQANFVKAIESRLKLEKSSSPD